MNAFPSWAVSLMLVVAETAQPSTQAQMIRDVLRMIRAAERVARLMPGSGPVPEVDLVVRHGKAVVPLLIRLLPDDPDDPALYYEDFDARKVLAGQQFAWRVQQNAAVALCRIYHVSAVGDCPMYGVRATHQYNRSVKPFWVKTIRENP